MTGARGGAVRRDHGGDVDAAVARWGGARDDWLDLSTGINPVPYPVDRLPGDAWSRLPSATEVRQLETAARAAFGVPDAAGLAAVPGLSAAIRTLPRLEGARPGSLAEVAIPSPTYNEHAAAWADAGWQVGGRPGPATRAIVLVTPNNPDGRIWERHEIATLAEAVPRLVVDESFVEHAPELSVAPTTGQASLVVLRSFGKFWGLAGLRLGFVAGPAAYCERLRSELGPWAVSGPALEIGARALADEAWTRQTRVRLARDVERLKGLGRGAGWGVVGTAGLFVTFSTGDAAAWQARLARARIWSRIFPYSDGWVRLGLPGDAAGWDRLAAALRV